MAVGKNGPIKKPDKAIITGEYNKPIIKNKIEQSSDICNNK